MPRAPLVALALLLSACNTSITHFAITTTSGGGTTRPSMEDETTGDEDEEDPADNTSTTGADTSSSSGSLADTGSTSLNTSTTTGGDETTGTETTSTDTTSADDTTSTSTTTGEPDPCGNGVIDADEQCDGATPHPGVGCSDTCAYDFGSISQLFCAGTCTWAGPNGCDAADADVFCRLRTGNLDAHATAFDLGAPTNEPGFACANLEVEFPGPDPRVNLGAAAGVDHVLYVVDLQGTHGGGATSTIVAVTCAE